MQSRNSRNTQGIDVSHHNGKIDWLKVKADGRVFAFIKASQGKSFRDDQFVTNVRGARAAGLLVGAYHFLNATTLDDARAEASNFAAAIQVAGGADSFELPPVLDYENNPGGLSAAQITAVAIAFLVEIERLTDRRPIIYTGNSFAGFFDVFLGSYKLWIARYSDKVPTDTKAWSKWDI
ncbi:glycoside hydrolase family 25 protein [Paenibacillus sp. SN-8-1]|uniref:glycoside hydrolase family 25 protein n=1 Tax=Paenibacillus sp. SN-8-1 TaxID=3435409 RepID=UPI003D9A468D